ncbi:hypothetical protein P171DRAFT_256947 [Karstenula rhodostoma CBS 690.94]|uniref:Uncharacterized protein n=1 Tax=Karstenula rhodostoma CBS 690.94 TaxID=1392251 RepID=A0A9P4PLC6_9PLEO|nr:hypothetical protein P171DRAFT_256947 [Karstenula rhodostoma CBS 690.94]
MAGQGSWMKTFVPALEVARRAFPPQPSAPSRAAHLTLCGHVASGRPLFKRPRPRTASPGSCSLSRPFPQASTLSACGPRPATPPLPLRDVPALTARPRHPEASILPSSALQSGPPDMGCPPDGPSGSHGSLRRRRWPSPFRSLESR